MGQGAIVIPLPIDPYLPEISAMLQKSGNLVLVAEPGAGKTTRVPPAVISAGILPPQSPNLLLLQPRRVATRAAAARIAQENSWTLGKEVGYQVRFEKHMTADTRIRVVTEGILTRQLLDDPLLEGIGAVVLDEFHERSLHTDLALALLREVKETVRDDLKIVVMSATLDAQPVADYLGGAPIVRVPGRTFPIEIRHAPPPAGTHLIDHLPKIVIEALGSTDGDILIFLPGAEEIRRLTHRLTEKIGERVLLTPLFGALTMEEQHRAVVPDPQGRRKVILATNIAETSLTIEGVTAVIDSGLARVAGFDAARGLDRLDLKRISRASATQRAGRAGRTGPGKCIRLWSAAEDRNLKEFELPEVKRVDLSQTILTITAWGTPDIRKMRWFDSPPEETLAAGEKLLEMLGAIEKRETGFGITAIGKKMLAIPAHPRIARMLVAAADAGLQSHGAVIAALLSEKDFIKRSAGPTTQASSDLLVRLDLLDQIERGKFASHWRDRGVDLHAARQIARTRDDFLRVLRQKNSSREATEAELLKLPLLAYPDRVVKRRQSDSLSGIMVGGSGVKLAGESAVTKADLYVAIEARNDDRAAARQAKVTIASAVDPAWLDVRTIKSAEYDEERDRVVGVTREMYRDLILREERHGSASDAEAAEVLGEVLKRKATQILAADEYISKLLARIELLRHAMPEKSWPAFDAAAVGDLLSQLSLGKRSVSAVIANGALATAIKSQLAYPLDRILDAEAPESIEVPSGSNIRITYAPPADDGKPPAAPILAVRLQELFGWTQTPRIAGGRVPLLLHLLSPAYRPVQITSDLASFWNKAYFSVRKDLRADYPKHSWPEDPLTAKAEAKGRRRQS